MIRVIATLFALAATPAFANCEEMWFVRNLIFDNAGMCFNSPLGRAMFDNSDCTPGKQVEIGSIDEDVVAQIKAYEADLDCAIDTSRTTLDIPYADLLRSADQLPVVGMGESACFGFNAPTIPVRSNLGIGAAITGSITAGDTVYFNYDDFGGWEFVMTDRIAGWIPLGTITADMCTEWAG